MELRHQLQQPLRWLQSDGRHYQVLFLSGFLCFGIFYLGWDADVQRYLITFSACLLVQAIGIHFTTKDYSGLKSAAITSLSLCLLMRSYEWYAILLAGMLAIGGKFLIRFNGKHVFNPANFGMMTVILLTGQAWISPGQWGSGAALVFLVGVAGMLVLFRVGRLDTAFAFLITFGGLMFVRMVLWQGWELDVWLHQMNNGSLLLFTFFMITDPVSTPGNRMGRIAWAVLIGAVAYVLAAQYQVVASPLWALYFIAPLTAVIDRVFIAQPFKWKLS